MNRIIAILALLIGFLLGGWIALLLDNVYASDRCQQYAHEVRTQHFKYFGLNYPYWYGIGQLKQESGCRADLTAFDGGKGMAQFMPRTWQEIETDLDIELNPYNSHHAIRAQAWYMSKLYKQNWDGRLFLTYMFYNSGYGTVKKEAQRAGITDYEKMKEVCSRKVFTLKSGKLLDLCQVGYDYPVRIYNYSQQYRTFKDKMRYW